MPGVQTGSKSDAITKLNSTSKLPDLEPTSTAFKVHQPVFGAPSSTVIERTVAQVQPESGEFTRAAQANGQGPITPTTAPAASAPAVLHGDKRAME
ncbi:hypothetical protein W97_04988 [Coniosporium apollinis CBS 100218]|uniref:Uncharacterized protein n=1 Tax=Coniosporium apollinis (strain CBS 100218) TaxID=1168221 RepID=R7YVB6_CONA1|nr:uncharacterized protein W97_04988 [Coniosporium apollinis CBS 100218]EON65749.1 hypothetical protein W97_04988 [Coniosporium apollinis CBS 100218]